MASVINRFLDKKPSGGAAKSGIMPNKRRLDLPTWQLAEELHKSIFKIWKKKYNNLLLTIFVGADLEDMQLISKFNKGFRFLLSVIDIYSKYAWVPFSKDKNR